MPCSHIRARSTVLSCRRWHVMREQILQNPEWKHINFMYVFIQLLGKHTTWPFNSSVAPKPTCNWSSLFCSLLFPMYIHNIMIGHGNCAGPSPEKFTKTMDSINIHCEIMKTKVQLSSGNSKPVLQVQRVTFYSIPNFGQFFFPVLQPSHSSFICGKSQCLETGNQFAFTKYNCGLL